jgi:3-phosphoshikimate 1-carboxyvinyltransferase
MIIHGGNPIRSAKVESRHDHRIAMAFSILALFADAPSLIEDTDCIATSYPTFEQHLAQVVAGDVAGKFRIGASLVNKVKRLVKSGPQKKATNDETSEKE